MRKETDVTEDPTTASFTIAHGSHDHFKDGSCRGRSRGDHGAHTVAT